MGSGCPECARQRSCGRHPQREFLKDELPDVYAELHPTKNAGVDTDNLTCGSAKRVWWLCQSNRSRPEGCKHEHEWEAQVKARCSLRRPTGCPFCNRACICPCESLATLQQTLMQYWEYASNAVPLQEPLDPLWVGQHSKRKAWWRHVCVDGQVHHSYAKIWDVVRAFNLRGRLPCPRCAAATRAAIFAEHAQRAARLQLIKRT